MGLVKRESCAVFKVLVVDDSPLMRQFVARALGMTGFELDIHDAGTGLEAIRLAEDLVPDLIITDLNMPVMDGEEFLRILDADTSLRTIPVIVLTADGARAKTDSVVHHHNLVACLRKPIRPEELKLHLERLLDVESCRVAEPVASGEGWV